MKIYPQAIIFPGQWQKIKARLLESSSRGNFLPQRRQPAPAVEVARSDAVIFPGQKLLVDRSQNIFTGHNLVGAHHPKSLHRPNFLPKKPVSNIQPAATFSSQDRQIDNGLSLNNQGESIPIYISHQGHRAGGVAVYHLPAYASHSPGLNFHTHDGSFHAHTQFHHPHQHEHSKDFPHNIIHAQTQLEHSH